MKVLEEVSKNKNGLIAMSYDMAKKAHAGQLRATGEPYFSHSLATAQNLADWGMDETTIAAGLLHDVPEDTKVTLEMIEEKLGPEVKFLVDGVTKLGRIKYRGAETKVDNLRKMFIAMAEDLRVVIIKLADRYHNIKTLSALPLQKQKRIALETIEIYAPLASRLGMQKVSGELEDMCFPYVYPKEYRWLVENVKYKYEEKDKYLKKIKPIVDKALDDAGIHPISIDFRAKRYASLYKKMLRKDMDLDQVHDLVAFRIIVKNIEDCYATLGIIHKLWRPLPGFIKDYIAMPKPNGYKSLHTSVICIDQKIVEFQIRTEEMHFEAENGIAAYWAYQQMKGTKEYMGKRIAVADKKELAWVEQLRAWQNNENLNPEELLDSFKIDFFKDRIFAITPKGEVIDLPLGSTPVDFAYKIHSDLGNQCIGSKVNGKIVPLDYKLKPQDVVEIIIQKGKKPSPSWLDFAVTSGAKEHIRNALKKGNNNMMITKKRVTEFRILAQHRLGLFKDLSGIISRSHINILSLDSRMEGHSKFYMFKIKCDLDDKDKVLKLILKFKTLKEVKEIDYRFV